MNIFAKFFETSDSFASEHTVKSLMTVPEVINAHVNWKSRLNKFMDGSLGYALRPEILSQDKDSELGIWIVQSLVKEGGDDAEKKESLEELLQLNESMHRIATKIVENILFDNALDNAELKDEFATVARKIMMVLLKLSK